MTTSPLIVLERAVDVHHRLDRAGVAHAIGGALALAYHVAQARATNDIDLNVSADPKHPEAVFGLLPPDVPWTEGDVAAVRRDGQVRLLWPLPEGDGPAIPLDLFFPQHALHAAIDARTELVPMLDATVPILSATDLLVFKALFDRRKDWADIEELVRFGKPDVAEARRWLTKIVGAKDHRLAALSEIVDEVTDGPSA
ncbi:MAG TPA: hypothetical protein VG899_16370 [Mycobacteriales bacterium]|nr:hypothetical protein [Mycobacteriales bacterium]